MKKILVLTMMAALILLTTGLNHAIATVTGYSQRIEVHTTFNAFGIAIESTSTTTTDTTTTTPAKDKDGNPILNPDGTPKMITSTTHEVMVVHSSWRGGGLKTDSATTTSDTTSDDGSYSHSSYTDTYVYDGNGVLIGCHGSGGSSSYDAETKQTTTGSISRSFQIKDGQALLTSQTSSGTTKDKDGKPISSYSSTSTYSYVYLGGSWVVDKVVSTSRTDKLNTATGQPTGEYEEITRVITYYRDPNTGFVTGMGQTATGTKVVNNQGAWVRYTMTDYRVDIGFDSRMGYYVKDEYYTWANPTPISPPGGGGGGGGGGAGQSHPWTGSYSTTAHDGMTLAGESADIQAMFRGTWGDAAAMRWSWEHDCEIGWIRP